MRRILFFIAATVISANASTNVVMSIVMAQPMPHSFSAWQSNDRNLIIVTIQNFDAVTYTNVRLSGVVKDEDNGVVYARTNDNDPRMPRFVIPASPALNVPGVLILHGRDCIDINTIIIDPTLKSQAIATNALPDRNYSFCVKILKEDGTELPYTGNGCSNFSVLHADPPTLIAPEEEQSLKWGTMPVFNWTQVGPVTPGTMITYWLKVVPVFAAQTSRDAMEHNEVLFRMAMPMTTYQYVPSNLPFTTYPLAIGFAWQITALDETNQPLSSNDGKSDIHTFKFDAPPVLTPIAVPGEDKNVSGGRGPH